ncbi:MAG: hypothetical protein HY785_01045 [Oscillatoriophycideae cyanobacterium NC_groundwater_1537_Pr4_S-0.65um_50_18]|nr:hypothetical protein [Oscillatoriophycideae cyanobacterium NC_groundwater_1537_Pr4_S-0.65um_50_18]
MNGRKDVFKNRERGNGLAIAAQRNIYTHHPQGRGIRQETSCIPPKRIARMPRPYTSIVPSTAPKNREQRSPRFAPAFTLGIEVSHELALAIA